MQQIPAPIQVHLQWRAGVQVPATIRERVHDEIGGLSWELSQAEALLHDITRVAGHERAWLMPRIELRLPLYDQGRRFRIVFSHIEKPRVMLVDEDGKKLADLVIA